jgi:hypothetical protein
MDARKRMWIETGLSAASAVFALLTIVWKDWIELIFRIDPDNGSGAAEWGIALAALALAVVFAVAARIEWRHLRAAAAAA